jgi:prevent-host-death family protein
MAVVTLADAKTHLSALVDQAARGETVRITRHGKPVAQLTTIEQPRKPIDVAGLRRLTDRQASPPAPPPDEMRRIRDDERY